MINLENQITSRTPKETESIKSQNDEQEDGGARSSHNSPILKSKDIVVTSSTKKEIEPISRPDSQQKAVQKRNQSIYCNAGFNNDSQSKILKLQEKAHKHLVQF